MKTQTFTAPEHWASAIVNGDYSGLEAADISALNTFLATEGLSFSDCLDCTEAGFLWRHDATAYAPGGAQCARYTFRKGA